MRPSELLSKEDITKLQRFIDKLQAVTKHNCLFDITKNHSIYKLKLPIDAIKFQENLFVALSSIAIAPSHRLLKLNSQRMQLSYIPIIPYSTLSQLTFIKKFLIL